MKTGNQKTWRLVRTGPGEPAFNMAHDEAMLEAAQRLGHPVLRFYSWREPAASFGYFQRYGTVERLTRLRPLVRRPTGGGVVPHDADWTYSLVFPPEHPWYSFRALDSYHQLHAWLGQAFMRLGVPTTLAVQKRTDVPGCCFVGADMFDILSNWGKLAGAAQRRTRSGLLIQGSVQPSGLDISRSNWEMALCDVARENWGVHWRDLPPDAGLSSRAEELARDKYARDAYNQRR